MTAIEYLDQQAKLLYPLAVGVSIGQWDNKRTWKIDLADGTRINADDISASFDKESYDVGQVRPTLEARVSALEGK